MISSKRERVVAYWAANGREGGQSMPGKPQWGGVGNFFGMEEL